MKRFPGALALPALAYLACLFLVPTGIVLSYSVCERDLLGGVHPRVSAQAWRMATDAITLRILLRTLLLAGGVCLTTALLAYPAASVLARQSPQVRMAWTLLLSFPLMTSLLLRTYGWMHVLPLGLRGTSLGVGLVLAGNYLPFMLLPLLKAMERADPTLVWAALDLGATPAQAFWRVTFPITLRGALAGALLVFIPVSGEYLIPHFIGDGQVSVMGTLIMEWFDHRHWPYAAACATWLVAVILLPMLAAASWGLRQAGTGGARGERR
jgi:ABC-type spermidine/putrescine transport system permease subunit I